jgi:excisionase family DNA binding protein
MNDFDPLITTREAMQILSESRSGLYAKLRAGTLAAVKDGGATKIRASELRRYMNSLPRATYAPSCYNAAGVA